MTNNRIPAPNITKAHDETLAALRHALRNFLMFSEQAAQVAGILRNSARLCWRSRDSLAA